MSVTRCRSRGASRGAVTGRGHGARLRQKRARRAPFPLRPQHSPTRCRRRRYSAPTSSKARSRHRPTKCPSPPALTPPRHLRQPLPPFLPPLRRSPNRAHTLNPGPPRPRGPRRSPLAARRQPPAGRLAAWVRWLCDGRGAALSERQCQAGVACFRSISSRRPCRLRRCSGGGRVTASGWGCCGGVQHSLGD